jgi:hypothetical protein
MPQIKFTFTFEEPPDEGPAWREEDLVHHAQALKERIEHSAAKVVGTHVRTEESKVILDVDTDENAASIENDIRRYDGASFSVQSESSGSANP